MLKGRPGIRLGGRIPSLDGLRAVSISLVLLGHLAAAGPQPLGDIANLGVRIFFVISGFLITSLLLEEHRRTGGISLKLFYLRRTFRIFPPFYAFLLALGAAALLGWVSIPARDMIRAATYTINYVPDRCWWVGHIWSLSVEEQFYLLWPAIVCLAGRRRGLFVAAGVILLAPLWRVAIFEFFPGSAPGIGETFPTVADALASGCLLAGLRGWLGDRGWYRRLLASRWFPLVPLAAFAANLKGEGRIRSAVLVTVINLALAVSIDWAIRFSDGFAGRILNSRPFVRVGVLSYSIYLVQQPFFQHDSTALVSRFPLNLVIVAVLATLSYQFVETPFLNMRRRIEARITRTRGMLAAAGD